ncbi:hypothetical protein KEM55_004813 [Ascosphaera atra]|nr:hypothetical protein KEM55_004813 [Ascosphaera atra]
MGVILLPTVLYLSKTLSKLAIGLDKRPELIAHLLKADPASDGSVEATETVTLVEKSANIVREAFIKCLTDRTGVIGRPEGKRKGIYLMANLCLKLLFKCGKLRNAEQMFASIQAHSPPLSMFPAAQRVTYLYYLGRYLFSNNLFWPAKIALETAYTQCHRQAFAQRRKILVHLISTNIILGRFPSSNLLQRPEATSLAPRFLPLCKIIASGDVPYFRAYLAPGSPHAEWFSQKGVLLQLRNRCEILVWRSLTRKVFIADGFHGQDPNENQNQRGPPPFVWLWKIEAAANWLEERQQEQRRLDVEQPQAETCGTIFKYPQDPEFARQDRAARGGQFDTDEFEDYLHPTAHYTEAGEWSSNNPNPDVPQDQNYPSDIDPFSTLPPPSSADLLSSKQEHTSDSNGYFPSTSEIEAILSSLLTQDLLHGYLTHKNPRFAIPGAKTKGALATGWPNVWRTIETRESADAHVPGWVRSPAELKSASNAIANARAVSASPGPALGMGGRVVNLSGARPVGSGM